MKFKRFTINIIDIIPQQHYLSKPKLNRVLKSFDEYDSFGDIFVILYKDLVFCVDGHHRLYHLYHQGVEQIEVVNELKDNESLLYQRLADEALSLGIKTIADLENRIIETQEEYKKLWIDKCQGILRELSYT